MSAYFPKELLTLISHLKRLPGVGSKTAERFAFQLLQWKESQLGELGSLIREIPKLLQPCEECGCIKGAAPCNFCNSNLRTTRFLCIISSPKDAFAIEETKTFNGLYHVMESLLCPLECKEVESRHLKKLKERIEKLHVQEVIIALDSTLEGDATALFLKSQLSSWGISLSRLAFGLPVGSPLEYIDAGTLSRALKGRQNF